MNLLFAALWMLFIIVLGYAWLRIVDDSQTPVITCFGIGSVFWGYGLFLFQFYGWTLTSGHQWILMGLISVLMGAAVGRTSLTIAFKTELPSPPVAFLILSLCLLYGFQTMALPIYHWDGLVLYAHKAQVLFYRGTYRTAEFYDKSLVHPNADYPLLVPYLEASFYTAIGYVNEKWVKIIFLVFWFSFIGLIYKTLREKLEVDLSWLGVLFFASLPLFSASECTCVVSGYVDIPFAFFWTGAILSILCYRRSHHLGPLLNSQIFLLGCCFCKPHGLLLLAIALFLLWKSLRWQAFVTYGLTLGFLLLPWLIVRHHLVHNVDYMPHSMSTLTLSRAFHRLWPVIRYVVWEMVHVSRWGLFWILTVGTFIFSFSQKKRATTDEDALILLHIATLQGILYMGTYLLVPNELGPFMDVTLSRLLIHLSGLVLIALLWTWRKWYLVE